MNYQFLSLVLLHSTPTSFIFNMSFSKCLIVRGFSGYAEDEELHVQNGRG